jgi:hypothetical protein
MLPQKRNTQPQLTRPSAAWFVFACAGALIVLGLVARLLWLRYIPFSYYHDELDYVFTGEAVARYGTNLSGNWSPWQLRPEITANVTGELPQLFQAIVQRIFGLGAEHGHDTSAVFGLLTTIAVGYLAYALWHDKRVAFWSSVCFLITPWEIHISRLAYEAPISLFFQVIMVIGLFKLIEKRPTNPRWRATLVWFLVAAIGAFFAYYTYHAAKLVVPVILFGTLIYALISKRLRRSVAMIAVLLVFVGSFLLRTQHQNAIGQFGSRASEFITSADFLSKSVNDYRLNSLELPGTNVLINKWTVLASEAFKRYVSVFDINRIALSGYESGFQFSLIVSGFCFVSVLALIVYGLILGLLDKDSSVHYVVLLILIGPVASVIEVSYQSIFRSALTYTALLIFAGYGLVKLSTRKGVWPRRLFVLALLGMILELAVFTQTYFNRFGVVSAQNEYFDTKLLAGYLHQVPTDRAVTVVTNQPYTDARALISYNGLMPQLTMSERKQFANPEATTYAIGHVTLTKDCAPLQDDGARTYVVEGDMVRSCGYAKELSDRIASASGKLRPPSVELPAISSQVGSGTYFNIIDDTVCRTFVLPQFVRAQEITAFEPSSLAPQVYCQTWIKRESIDL